LYFAWSWLFGSGNTIPQYLESKKEIRGQIDSIKYYQDDIRRLDDILDERESNLDVLEKFAREQYNFSAKNEDVYILE
jgi:cell division protein FtsB